MSSHRSRVLILTVKIGAGHFRAAQALGQVLQAQFPEGEVILQDHLALLHPRIPFLWSAFYLRSLKYLSSFYRKTYQLGIQGEHPSPFWRGYRLLVLRSLRRYLRRIRPILIVTTYAPLAGVLQELRKEALGFPPVAIVNTDFGLGPLRHWPGLDLYTVACEENAQELIERGVPQERVLTTGIPISLDFAKPYSSLRYALLGKGAMPKIVIGGGGAGVGPLLEVLYCFCKRSFPGSVTVLAGGNQKLVRRARRIANSCDYPEVRVWAYSDRLSDLYSKAHLLISKPGGLTIAEAWAQGLPLIPLTPIPGLEEENLLYLQRKGLPLSDCSPEAAVCFAQDLLRNPSRLEELSWRVYRLSHPDSVYQVSRALFNLLLGRDGAPQLSAMEPAKG